MRGLCTNIENPTNGSWWMFQIQPTKNLTKGSLNTTNGSWWIVQIQPNLPTFAVS